MKVLLAVDGSPFTGKMLNYLITHLAMFSGTQEFTVLTVQAPLPAGVAVVKEAKEAYYAEESAKALDPAIKLLEGHGLKVKGLTMVGNVGELIAKTADSENFDLIMMGSHGRSALGKLVMGSVATHVLAQSKTPLLLVR